MRAAPAATLLAELLREIDGAAYLADFTETPDGPWYSIRVETPGDVGKALVLPKSLMVDAGRNAAARRTLTNVRRAEVMMRRSRDVMQPSRRIAAEARSELDPVCPRCSKPIPPGESVRFEHGEIFHIQCSS